MPGPTPLHIAAQAVQRLLKEEEYYEKELAQQEKQVKKLEDDFKNGVNDEDGNAEYVLKQNVSTYRGENLSCALRISDAVGR
jgi:tubulin-specific chaperone A